MLCSNIVFMGMGEPLHNMDAVLPSIDIMTHPLGLHLSSYKVCCRLPWCASSFCVLPPLLVQTFPP